MRRTPIAKSIAVAVAERLSVGWNGARHAPSVLQGGSGQREGDGFACGVARGCGGSRGQGLDHDHNRDNLNIATPGVYEQDPTLR